MRRKTFELGLALAGFLLGFVCTARADVYVSGAGNDLNDGLTAGTPKLTLAAALGVYNGQAAGSVLHVLSNITESAILPVTGSGASGNPKIIRSDPATAPFTLAGVVFEVTGSFVTIQSLKFDGQGAHEACVVIKSVASDCIVNNCQFTGVASTAEVFAKENVPAFIPIQGAANVTISGCTFTPTVNTDNMVILSDMAGPANNFTMTGCTVSSTNFAGGVKCFRRWDNIQILNTRFLDMRIYSFELDSSASTIDTSTSNNILIQDCIIRGYISTSSDPGAVRILSSRAYNLRVVRCAFSNLGTGGVEGISVFGVSNAPSSIDTLVVDGVTFQKDPTSTSAFQTPVAVKNTSGLTPPTLNWSTNVTIRNCVLNAAVCVQYERSIGVNVTIQDCTLASAGANSGTLLRMVQGSRLYNMLVERVRANNTLGDDCLAFNTIQNTARPEAHGVIVRNCNFTSRTAAATYSTNNEGISFKDGPYSNVEVRNTYVNADVGFNISRAGASLDGLVIDNCVINAGTPTLTSYLYGGILLREDGTAPGATLRNAVVTNTSITGVSGITLANSSSPQVVENVSFTNCAVHGYAQGVILTAVNDMRNVSFTNCTFDGPLSGFAALVTTAATLNCRDLALSGCQITCTTPGNDITTLRPAGFLWETANSRLTYATMTNCTFRGGNHAFSIARNNIPLGPGDEPIVNGLLVQDCTMENAFSRGLNIAYADGGNLTFRRVAIRNVPAIGANLQFYGDNVLLENVTVNGGGLAQGMVLSTKAGNVASGWRVRNCALSNLAAGLTISGPVRNSTLEGVTITGQGIAMDNSAAGSAADAAQAIDVVACRCTNPVGIGIAVEGLNNRVLGCTVENGASTGIAVRETNLLLPANQNVSVLNNTITGCVGAAILLEGKNSTVGSNSATYNGAGVIVRSGNSGLLTSTSNTTGNLITRNGLLGGLPASATGISEPVPSFFGDPGPSGNIYLNNTATDWVDGGRFVGSGNTIQNNIFAFNVGSGLKILPGGLSGLTAGWNCAAGNGVNFDGIAIDYSKDIWYDPDFVSRDPVSPSFYLLSAASGCLDRGTPVGTGVDLGCRESGTSEVQSWRLY